jgi:hypothetical protein
MPFHEVDWSDGKHDLGAFLTAWSQGVADELNAAPAADGSRAVAAVRTRGEVAAAAAVGRSPSPPDAIVAARYADHFGVDLVNAGGGPLGAVLFVSGDHKADSDGGLVFALRVATRAAAGVGVVVVDVAPGPATWAMHLNTLIPVYPTARRPRGPGATVLVINPRTRDGAEQYDVWYYTVAAGGAFPTVPLPSRGDTHPVVDLDATYTAACGANRNS